MEKCMMTASVAFLLCHPNSSIKCSNPCKKQNKKLESSKQEKPRIRKPSPQLKPHKCEPAAATTTRLRLVYDHLGSTQYPSIEALDHILRRGWSPNEQGCSSLVIDKVLKVNHKDGFVDKFDRYREIVKGKAASSSTDIAVGRGVNKKLREDGFELLSFVGARLACVPRMSSEQGVCRKRYCGVCSLIRIIESSSLERLRSLSVSENVWMAHHKAVKECGDDRRCRKAVIICRVIAGRIADHRRWRGHGPSVNTVGTRDDEFDSVFVPVTTGSDSHDELLVFNPSAILPCFVILYNLQES